MDWIRCFYFLRCCNGVAWNGTLWVAVGWGINEIAYSSDGINWTPVTGTSASIFSIGNSIAWNGIRWVAVVKEQIKSHIHLMG